MRILRGWRKATDLRAYPSDYGTETLFADIDQAGQKFSLLLQASNFIRVHLMYRSKFARHQHHRKEC